MESSKSKKILSERALGIRFRGSGGLWGTERRPGEPQGGLQELQSHDPSSLPSDSELPRSSDGHRSGCGGAAAQLRPPFDGSNICRRRGPLKLRSPSSYNPRVLEGGKKMENKWNGIQNKMTAYRAVRNRWEVRWGIMARR